MQHHQAQDRNADFIHDCITLLKKPGNDRLSISELIDLALASPAPCYYADYNRASAILRKALITGELPHHYRSCSKMWHDMLADLRALIQRHPRQDIGELIMRLCVGHAGNPRYYISRRRALQLIKPYVRLVPAA